MHIDKRHIQATAALLLFVFLLIVPSSRAVLLYNVVPLSLLGCAAIACVRLAPGPKTMALCIAGLIMCGAAIHAHNLLHSGILLDPDSRGYIGYARDFAAGRGFGDMLFRGPLYPFFLGLTFLLGNLSLMPAVVLQHFFLAACIPLVYLLCRLLAVSEAASLFASLLFTLNAMILQSGSMIMTEALYLVLLLLAFFSAVRAYIDSSKVNGMLMGICFSIVAYLRPGIESVFLIAAAAIGIRWRKRALLPLAIAIGAFLVLTAPWSIRNQVRFGTYGVSRSTGVHLFTKAIHYQLLDTAGPAFKTLRLPLGHAMADLNVDAASWRKAPEDAWEVNAVPHALKDSLMAYRGYSYVKADRLLARAGLEGISRHPGGYLVAVKDALAVMLFHHREIYPSAGMVVPGKILALLSFVPQVFIRGFFYVPGILFVLFPVYLLYRKKLFSLWLLPFLFGIAGPASVALVEVGLTRYTIPWIPFWIICVSIMLEDGLSSACTAVSGFYGRICVKR